MESPSSSNEGANDANEADAVVDKFDEKLEAPPTPKRSDSEHDYKEKLEAMKQLADRYEKQLNEEQVEEKVTAYEKEATELKAKISGLEGKFDDELVKLFDKFAHLSAFNKQQQQIFEQLSQRYHKLSGHYEKTSSELRDEQIALPQTVPELQFDCLRLRESLIEARAVKEHAEEEHASEIEVLNSELERFRLLCVARSCGTRSPTLERRLNESQAECAAMGKSLNEYRQRCSQLQVELDTSEAVQKDFVKLSQHLQVQLEKIRSNEKRGTCPFHLSSPVHAVFSFQVRWQFAEDVTHCNGCEQELKRQPKTNCMHCGKIFCPKCVDNVITTGPNNRPAKVCNVCHTLVNPQSVPFFSNLMSNG
ncbi:FYVE zinc finger [Aphelenchoides fujianensis]|nr:FYVE zinc finger [Aphelenchoides fujianensis]